MKPTPKITYAEILLLAANAIREKNSAIMKRAHNAEAKKLAKELTAPEHEKLQLIKKLYKVETGEQIDF